MHDLESRYYFNQLAEKWSDKVIDPGEDQCLLELLQRMKLNSHRKILDVGCGTGRLFHLLEAYSNEKSNLVALDYAFEMTQKALKNSNRVIKVLCADVSNIPFSENMFDSIIAFGLFPHIAHRQQALSEFYRILKPDGSLGIMHLKGSRELNKLHQGIGGVVRDHRLPDCRHIKMLLGQAGFKVMTAEDQVDRYLVVCVK